VPAISALSRAWKTSARTGTVGMFVINDCHVAPPSFEKCTPFAWPTASTFASRGCSAIRVTGVIGGNPVVIARQLCPKSLLTYTYVPLSRLKCPSNVAYTRPATNRDANTELTIVYGGTPGIFPVTFAHVPPPSRVTDTCPSLLPV
jgi:hypothetical protein